MILDSKIPEGPLEDKWTKYKSSVQSELISIFNENL